MHHQRRNKLCGLRTLSSVIAVLSASTAIGQTVATEDTAPATADIIVTAAKREQTLQDVAISVSVTTDAQLERAQINDLLDLSRLVPSLSVSQLTSTSSTQFSIRGFGTAPGEAGFEGSVGVFIDGVYRARAASALSDLPDVERIEVLRGPQSTLFGKSVSAGAISIVTKRPQFDWSGRAEATVGNFGALQANSSVTGPISKSLAFRLYASVNSREGFFRNISTGKGIADRNRFGLRGDILFQPSSDISIRIIGDYNELREACCGASPVINGPATEFLIGGDVAIGGLGAILIDPARAFERDVAFDTNPVNFQRGQGISAQVDWDFGGISATSITSYRNQKSRDFNDVDFTAARLINQNLNESLNAFTQEIRLSSDGTRPFTWLIGAFYSQENYKLRYDLLYGDQFRQYLDGLTFDENNNVFALSLAESVLNALDPSLPIGAFAAAGVAQSNLQQLKSTSYSIFGQVDFAVNDKLTLTGGVAYLHDSKRAAVDIVTNDPFYSINFNDIPDLALFGLAPDTFASLSSLQFLRPTASFPDASDDGRLRNGRFVYLARAAYAFTDRLNVYVSYSTGWKGGVVSLSTDIGVGEDRRADPENVVLYEIGLKTRFNRGFLTLAAFQQSIRGFQVNDFINNQYRLSNAGKQTARGVELDLGLQPVRGLDLLLSATFLDPRYDTYRQAPCVAFDVVRCSAGQVTRDLSGQRPSNVSRLSLSTSGTYTQDFGGGLSGYVRGQYSYGSRFQTADSVPPGVDRPNVHTVDASIGLTMDNGLEAALFVNNLTRTNYFKAIFPTTFQPGSYSGFPNDPRTFGLNLRKSF